MSWILSIGDRGRAVLARMEAMDSRITVTGFVPYVRVYVDAASILAWSRSTGARPVMVHEGVECPGLARILTLRRHQ